jgi:hypothetical protein
MVISHSPLYAVLKLTMRQLLLIPTIRYFLSSTKQRVEMNLFSSANKAHSYPAKMLLGWGLPCGFFVLAPPLPIGLDLVMAIGTVTRSDFHCVPLETR